MEYSPDFEAFVKSWANGESFGKIDSSRRSEIFCFLSRTLDLVGSLGRRFEFAYADIDTRRALLRRQLGPGAYDQVSKSKLYQSEKHLIESVYDRLLSGDRIEDEELTKAIDLFQEALWALRVLGEPYALMANEVNRCYTMMLDFQSSRMRG